jgi:hypothetical protein
MVEKAWECVSWPLTWISELALMVPRWPTLGWVGRQHQVAYGGPSLLQLLLVLDF